MTAIRTSLQNSYESTLTTEMGPNDLTAAVASIGVLTSPCYLTIEPDSDTQREVILFDGSFGASSFVTTNIAKRYLAGSAAGSNLTHPVGAIVRCTPFQQHIEDLHDRIEAQDHGDLAGLADDDHPQYVLADGSRAFTAEVDGVSPSGASGLATKGYVDSIVPDGIPAGVILPYGGSAAPSGYLLCDGSAISRITYANLFAAIGTAYGVGDGSTTFEIPDTRQRFLLGKAATGTGAAMGETGGTIDHIHSVSAHTHDIGHSHTDTFSADSAGAHTHSVDPPDTTSGTSGGHAHGNFTGGETAGDGDGPNPGIAGTGHYHTITSDGLHSHQVNVASFSSGSDGSHSHTLSGSVTAHSGASGSDGAGSTGGQNPPYLVVNHIIKT